MICIQERLKQISITSMLVSLMLTGCGSTRSQIQDMNGRLETGSKVIPRVSVESPIFLDISLKFLGNYQLPDTKFADTSVGGLSALSYDRQRSLGLMPLGFRVLALSDDRSDLSPARFYTLKVTLETQDTGSKLAINHQQITLKKVEVENVTFLKAENGETYAKGTIDPEGIALTPQRSVIISSEGIIWRRIPAFINEFDLTTGTLRQTFTLPKHYTSKFKWWINQTVGIRDNLGFEGLTINPESFKPSLAEPLQVFAATEAALKQDLDPKSHVGERGRILHYLIKHGSPNLISEYLYPIESPPEGAKTNGLTELLSLDQKGHFLSLERSYGAIGNGACIFQVTTEGATDISSIPSLKGTLSGISPVKKRLLLNLGELGIRIDNLEGMTLGPLLPDGSHSLLLVSDNNFNAKQITQFLLFRLKISP